MLTEQAKHLFLEFTITFRCIDVSQSDRGDGILTLRGDGFYDVSARKFEKLGSLGEELTFRDADGLEQTHKGVVMRVGGITIGHANASHTVRRSLIEFDPDEDQ